MTVFSKRRFLTGLIAGLATPLVAEDAAHTRAWQPRSYDAGLIPKFSFETMEVDLRGRLGVFALDLATGRNSGWAEDARFPVNSTFKFLLAGCVLRHVEAGQENLDARVRVMADDLVPWSPVLDKSVGQEMTVKALCHATMTTSDNGAANLLLQRLGGPRTLTAMLRDLGDPVTRIDRFEPDLNIVPAGAEVDTTTPYQMVHHMQRFLFGDVLRPANRNRLAQWMRDNETGRTRLRGGIPVGWDAGDRTGSSNDGATSNIGFFAPPGRAPLLIAVYMKSDERDWDFQSARHAELARIAAGNLDDV